MATYVFLNMQKRYFKIKRQGKTEEYINKFLLY